MSKPAWSWKDYERVKRREERKAARAAVKAATTETVAAKPAQKAIIVAPGVSLALAAMEALRHAPPVPRAKIDISAAPSGMEAAAARWQGQGVAPMTVGPVTVLCEAKVMCRCGAQGPGQTRGPVPVWFGDKCIEANRELRARRGVTEKEGASRG